MTELPAAALLCEQNWEDEDVGAALEALAESLAANIVLLSSWDKYKKEVLSGSLEWTPMHTSAAFWADNAPRFEERDFQARSRMLQCTASRCPALFAPGARARASVGVLR